MSNRLLIVTDAWYPQTNGVVRSLDAIGAELMARGWEVSYLTPDQFFNVPLPLYPEIKLAMAAHGTVADRIAQLQPDHIHIATEGPLGLQARLYCEWNGAAFTTSYHTRFPEYVAARAPIPVDMSYAYLRWFHWEATTTLVPTESVRRELAARGFRNLSTWTRGVDTSLFKPGPKTEYLDLPGPHLLYVGRVAVEKNVEAFLKLDVPGTKIVVGDGPQKAALERIYPDARFLGRKVGAELSALYRSADVFVFPSKTDTFGNVMLEALASGVPVAAYPVTGPIDILTDRRAGAMDETLEIAVTRALQLSREAAVAHAKTFTWAHCTDLFADALVPVHSAPARQLEAV